MLRFTKRIKNSIILVYSLVELALQLVSAHAYQEVANKLGNRLTHRPNSDLKYGINTCSHLSDEYVSTTLWYLSLLRRIRLVWLLDRLSILVVLDRHLFILRHY